MLDFFLTIGLYSSLLFFGAVVLTNVFASSPNPVSNDSNEDESNQLTNEPRMRRLLSLQEAMTVLKNEPQIAFITLTNNDYVHITLNCLRSLKGISGPQLKTYCIGTSAAKDVQLEGYPAIVLDTGALLSERQFFRKGLWGTLTQKKICIIHMNLLVNDFVCITDGDVVFCRDFWSYLIDNIGDSDLLIQNDTMEDTCTDNVCSGFMFIRKNAKTLKLFDPENTMHRINEIQFDDQVYMNEIKTQLDFKLLPLALFPNGKYYQNIICTKNCNTGNMGNMCNNATTDATDATDATDDIDTYDTYDTDDTDDTDETNSKHGGSAGPMMVHFNWTRDKVSAMKHSGLWTLSV